MSIQYARHSVCSTTSPLTPPSLLLLYLVTTPFGSLLTQIDANDDGRVSWEEFSSYVLQESMHLTSKGASSMLGSVFADRLPEDEYTDPSAYHRDMITGTIPMTAQ